MQSDGETEVYMLSGRETLQGIALDRNVSVATLMRLNHLSSANDIHARDSLLVPYKPAQQAEAAEVEVQMGSGVQEGSEEEEMRRRMWEQQMAAKERRAAVQARTQRYVGYGFMAFFYGANLLFHTAGYYIFIVPDLQDWFYVPYLYLCVGLAAVFYTRTCFGDPGFLPKNTAREAEMARASTGRLKVCTSCVLVRPLRSKHCRTCGRCVARFDHHCPFVNNCVGSKNHPDFVLLLIFEILDLSIALREGIPLFLSMDSSLMWYGVQKTKLLVLVLLFAAFFWVAVASLLAFALYRACTNITTNEFINHNRYDYISLDQNENAFDHGCLRNCHIFWQAADDPYRGATNQERLARQLQGIVRSSVPSHGIAYGEPLRTGHAQGHAVGHAASHEARARQGRDSAAAFV